MEPRRRGESARRCLFGPVEHEQLRRELKLRLEEMSEQDSRRWNFDFQTETPLPGRFQWEEMPTGRAAAFYQGFLPQPREVRPPGAGEGAGADQENRSGISNTHKSPAEVTPVRRKRTRSKTAAKSGRNARITDFFPKRRRTTETKGTLNPFHTSSTKAAQCKTIR